MVDTLALKPIAVPIKGDVFIVSRGDAGRRASVASTDSIDHFALLPSLAGSWGAHHNTIPGITLTAQSAVLVPEFFIWLVVDAIVRATTAFYGHTFVKAKDVALVTLAGFHTFQCANHG